MKRQSFCNSRSDVEEKKEKRRIAWTIAQEKEQEHECLKLKKIEEYERRRTELLGLNNKQKSLQTSHSKSSSRSKSEESYHNTHLKPRTSKFQIMSKKFNIPDGKKLFSEGPDKLKTIDVSELQQVTVKIHRKIPTSAIEKNEIRRIILNPEEITLKRREGEGTKPLFDREELKNSEKSKEVEEHRTIEAVGKSNTVKKSEIKYHFMSPSLSSHTESNVLYSRQARSTESYKYQPKNYDKDCKRYVYYSDVRESQDNLKRKKISEDQSYSRERDYHKSKHDYLRNEKERKEYLDRYEEHSYDRRERRERDSSREHLPTSPYLEQVPFPVYYGGYAPRPVLIRSTMSSIVRGRIPASIRPPYSPRVTSSQDVYRVILPHDPRYG